IAFDSVRATRLGVNVEMVDEMVNNAFSVRQIAKMYQTMIQYHVVMTVNDLWTRDPDVLSQMFVIKDRGERIQISDFASFSCANATLAVN
ncbi:efflux RND transporter permease subunit, partial [Erwinia amylovora]|uniref:efflux RND transporter permease subunit n=1 Tax=Erwinia amylovora TaxID=552 RepID=UPI00200B1EFF